MDSGDSPPRAGPGRHALLPDPLTDRELVVLQLLRGSLSRRDIAAELGRSPNTIKTQTQTQTIYRKLGVSTRRAAITRRLDTGILPPRGRQPH
jgi:LuxR family transcriptional regulator, maltose regulon positive regulatory protein